MNVLYIRSAVRTKRALYNNIIWGIEPRSLGNEIYRVAEEATKQGHEDPFTYISSEVDRHLLTWSVAASRISWIRATLGCYIEYIIS